MADLRLKRFLPRSLLGRSLLIIVTPLILVQVASMAIFFQGHWEKVTLGLARGVAGEIAAVIRLVRDFPQPEDQAWIFAMAGDNMRLDVALVPGAILPNEPPAGYQGIMEAMLARALTEHLGRPFRIDSDDAAGNVTIAVQLSDGVLRVVTPRKRLFSSTTYVFVLWSAGLSMILFGVAVIFMRNQVRPIRRLAAAADAFGKGREVKSFKPEGAAEVRLAATAFIRMRERIQRQIAQRTLMLSGVSHDLRTPLTRMKLQLAMLGDVEGRAELEEDVADLERMLEDYLAFARGEGSEEPRPANLSEILAEVVGQARRKGGAIDLHTEGDLVLPLRQNAVKRCLANLVENAARYAQHAFVRAGLREDAVEVVVDDDGPGIPEDKREDVFKPFVRLEQSRNPGTGGTGLGLSIALDVARAHGGEIHLSDSPHGGLRVRLRFPV